MTCNNCNCTCSDNTEEYQEFVPNKEYAIGEFFKIGREVFKVVSDYSLSCNKCEFKHLSSTCYSNVCEPDARFDEVPVSFILYDTLDEDE